MTKFNYDNRRFRGVSNQENGEVSGSTTFHYHQSGEILWATYQGGSVVQGTMTGIVHPDGRLTFAYQHVNTNHEIMTGRCTSTPELLSDGRIRIHESWQWTSGDCSTGTSVVEEI